MTLCITALDTVMLSVANKSIILSVVLLNVVASYESGCTLKLFTTVITSATTSKQSTVLVNAKYFYPSLIFVRKDGAYLGRVPFGCSYHLKLITCKVG